MNRIILIGNGFDLAHGLKTSYRDFIDDYWRNSATRSNDSKPSVVFEDDFIKIENITIYELKSKNFKELLYELKSYNSQLTFKNKFLEVISRKSGEINWVDIENEYYSFLKRKLSSSSNNNEEEIIKLNKDFKDLKELLIEYLRKEEEIFFKDKGNDFTRIQDQIGSRIYHPFKMKDFSETFLNDIIEKEVQLIKKVVKSRCSEQEGFNDMLSKNKILQHIIDKKLSRLDIKDLLLKEDAYENFDLIPDSIMLLNFNYTSLDDLYQNPKGFNVYDKSKWPEINTINIHGTIAKNDGNPVIFGFGDELDDDYKSIENLNNNIYLENIKSINYLETSNYKKLLEYINSSPFQVFIFGHSCGTSDRTMLNTMFEHDNCASIKLFYHQQGPNQDNFSDVVRNISRNFNDKAKMRDRVVNKTYCESLV